MGPRAADLACLARWSTLDLNELMADSFKKFAHESLDLVLREFQTRKKLRAI